MDVSRQRSGSNQTKSKNLSKIATLDGVLSNITAHSQREEISTIAISIISNSQLLREGLSALLSPHFKVHLIATYSGDYHSDLELLNPPGHMVLLDSTIGRNAVIRWIHGWRELFPSVDVFILELASDIDLIVACIEAGACGYTLQGASAIEVAQAIKDMRKGKAYSSPEVISRLFARLASLSAASKQRSNSILTERESEILQHLAAGYTNREIASHLVIELRTVKQHVHHILKKLNVRNRWEAARFAVQQGWIGYHLCLMLALICPSILDALASGILEDICTVCEI